MSTYDSDDALPHSPGLQAIKFKSTPSPSPPPFPQQHTARVVTQSVSPTSPRTRRKRPNRTRPSQGDTVLLSFLDPNRPDIAREAGKRALNSDSGSEVSESEGDMQDSPEELRKTARKATEVLKGHDPDPATPEVSLKVQEVKPDKDVEMNGVSPAPVPTEHSKKRDSKTFVHTTITGLPTPENFPSSKGNNEPTPVSSTYHEEDSLATSPNLRDYTIPPPKDSPDKILPALNPTSPSRDGNGQSSPKQSLPGFRHISELAEAANQDAQQAQANTFAHRSSISSTGAGTGLSPTLVSRIPAMKRASPPLFPPLNPISPAASHSDASPHAQDSLFPLKTLSPSSAAAQHYGFPSYRRLSQVSDGGHATSYIGHPPPLTSASTTESYSSGSVDGYSPNAGPPGVARSLSIGELTQQNPQGSVHGLSPPGALPLSHVPPHGSAGFKCDHPGCTAPPFQTQYLLNSHANVHSQARPHYCPVPGCSRAEGGKGFKRKNEMIRHGLVHESPGYVCPFCPERDHKYPRPDNLQRHVRVHHIDKERDDPQLREVLAQRPEGGGRGRRRRVGT